MTTGTLVRGGHVITSGPEGVLRDAAVRVVGPAIDAVGDHDVLRAAHPDDRVVGGPHDIVLPGLVTTHGHFSEGLITGIASHATLWEWIGCLIAPVAPHLRADQARAGTLVAGVQMLRSGVTTVNDMFVYDPHHDAPPATPEVARACAELGLRAVLSYGAGDTRGQDHALVAREHSALHDACGDSDTLTFGVGVAGVGAMSPALFDEHVERAVGDGHRVHIHLQEVREEVTAVRAATGRTPVAHCAERGLLDTHTLAAHCVWVDDHDIAVLAEHGCGVAHNPVANGILASGVAPVARMRAAGVAVGIGVDGAASNDAQDMLQAMKTAGLLARVHHQQATALRAEDVVAMATIEGARALGLDDRIGSLEVGKAADVLVLDGDSPTLANVHDPLQAVVWVAGSREVKALLVDGRQVVEDGEVTTVDPAEVAATSRPLARRLARDAGLAELSVLAR